MHWFVHFDATSLDFSRIERRFTRDVASVSREETTAESKTKVRV